MKTHAHVYVYGTLVTWMLGCLAVKLSDNSLFAGGGWPNLGKSVGLGALMAFPLWAMAWFVAVVAMLGWDWLRREFGRPWRNKKAPLAGG